MNVGEQHIIYKVHDTVKLPMRLFLPAEHIDKTRRAAIIFFPGGRFRGNPAQFFPQCRYFASRGMVAASASYRRLGDETDSIRDCLADSISALQWLRSRADELNIDPQRIIASGGSAGGNLAANTAMFTERKGLVDDTPVEADPTALVLFNPALFEPTTVKDLIDDEMFPANYVRPQLPPTLILHGTHDEFFPAERMQQFCEVMVQVGNRCDLKLYADAGHGFFNYDQGATPHFVETVAAADRFFVELGFLSGTPTVAELDIQSLSKADDWSRSY